MEFCVFAWQPDIWTIWYGWWARLWNLEPKTFRPATYRRAESCRCLDPVYLPDSIMPELQSSSKILGRRRRAKLEMECHRCKTGPTRFVVSPYGLLGISQPSSQYVSNHSNLAVDNIAPDVLRKTKSEEAARPSVTLTDEGPHLARLSRRISTSRSMTIRSSSDLPHRTSSSPSERPSLTLPPTIRRHSDRIPTIINTLPNDRSTRDVLEDVVYAHHGSESRVVRPFSPVLSQRSRTRTISSGLNPPPRPSSSRSAKSTRPGTADSTVTQQPSIPSPLPSSHNPSNPGSFPVYDVPRPDNLLPTLSFESTLEEWTERPQDERDRRFRLSIPDEPPNVEDPRTSSVLLGVHSRGSSLSTVNGIHDQDHDSCIESTLPRSKSLADSIGTFGGTSGGR